MTKHQLMQALFATSTEAQRIIIEGVEFASITSVEREDGSGHTFNVTGYQPDYGTKTTVFVRTID